MKQTYSFIIFAYIIGLLLSGCNKHSTLRAGLPEIVEIHADSIQTPPMLLSVSSLFKMGNDVLVVYQEKDDTLFSFWKLPECSYLFKAGIKGQGPNDFLVLDRSFQGTEQGFMALEVATNRIKRVEITDNNTLKVNTEKIDVNHPVQRLLFLADNNYCFFSFNDENEFALYNEDKGESFFGKYPDLISKEENEMNMFVYNKVTVATPKGDKFAAFYAYLKLCRIYAADGHLLKEVYLEGPQTLENGSRKMYYSIQPYATDRNIYVPIKQGDKCIVEVWNWEGEIVKRFLPDKPIHKFVVCPTNNRLYAITMESEDYIYIYDINI